VNAKSDIQKNMQSVAIMGFISNEIMKEQTSKQNTNK
jgi:hypothetical protein